MDFLLIILQLIILAALLAFGYIFRTYLPAYFTKKGENLATKEDIEDITRKIEGVRTQYAAQFEEIRHSIREIYDQRKSFADRQRNELLRFYDIATEFFYERIAVSFGEFPMDKGKSLFLYQKLFHRNLLDLLKSYQRIVIYFEHESPLRKYAEQVLLKALEARSVLQKYFPKVKFTSVELEAAFNSGDKGLKEKAFQASDEANSRFWDAMHPVADGFRDAWRQYLTALNLYIRPSETKNISEAFFKQ